MIRARAACLALVCLAATIAAPAVGLEPGDVDAALDAALAAEGDARVEALAPAMDPAALDVLGDAVASDPADRAAVALQALAELVEPAACEAIAAAPAHDDPAWRVAFANAAARCGDLDPLRALLSDDDPVLRLKAAVALGILGDAASEAEVVALLDAPDIEGHTAFVALAAGLLGRSEARGALDVMLMHGPTRVHAALALSRLGADDVMLDLIFALDDVGDPILRHAVLDEVVAHLPPTGRAAVEAMAATDPSPRIAAAAARAARRWQHLRPRDGRITESPPPRMRPRPD